MSRSSRNTEGKYPILGRRLRRLAALGFLIGALAFLFAAAKRSAGGTQVHVVGTRWMAASPERVFAVVTDPRKQFLTDNPITGMEVVGDRTEGVGTVYRWKFRLPFGPCFTFDEEVTAWEPNRRLAYRAMTGWEMTAESRLEAEGKGTRLTFTLDCRLPGLWGLIPTCLMKLGISLALAGIARRAEGIENGDQYIPALRFGWLTPLYDFAQRWIFRESMFKTKMVEQAHIEYGHRVLDLGCGTATLTVLIKEMHPQAQVVGLDGDPEVLETARSKAAKAGVNITFDQGMTFALPYPDGSFDRVLSSLMFHHLNRENKYKTMSQVLRVLRPGGEFLLADLGKQHGLAYLIGLILARLEEGVDNVKGLLPGMLREVGFEQVEEVARFRMPYGSVSFYRGAKPR